MAGEVLLVSQFAAAALMLALAGWLLWLRFESPLNRSFALFLVLRAMVIVTNRLQDVGLDAATSAYFRRTSVYFLVASPFALSYFVVRYAVNTRKAGRVAGGVLGIGVLVAEILYALDHCAIRCVGADGRTVLGGLSILATISPLISATAGLFLAWEDLAAKSNARRRARDLLAIGFLLDALPDAAISSTVVIVAGIAPAVEFAPSPWDLPYYAVGILALPVALVAFALLLKHSLTGAPRLSPSMLIGLMGSALATGVLIVIWPPSTFGLTSGLFLLGLWRLSLPLIVTFALLRHSLFDLDVRLRWGIARGTVGASFVAVFFVVSEITANRLSSEIGTVLGIIAAGLLVFVMAPLQHLAERIVSSAFSAGRGDRQSSTDEMVYREQAEIAWQDGSLDRSERRLLDNLRSKLGLSAEDAARLEKEAAEHAQGP